MTFDQKTETENLLVRLDGIAATLMVMVPDTASWDDLRASALYFVASQLTDDLKKLRATVLEEKA